MNTPLLFSIRPQYLAALLDGSKIYEYRTRRPSVEIGDTILLYESRGRGKIIARAEVLEVLEGTPAAIGEKTGAALGFDEYFAGRSRAVALRLRVEELEQHIELVQPAPQAWSRYRGAWPMPAQCAA